MELKLYNTLTRQKEEFKPIKPGFAGIYSCGPTVYWYQHIGNLRCYIFADILKRVLAYDNYQVKQVMNVTDVGHLTSDADEGEDKMEKATRDSLYIKCKKCGKTFFSGIICPSEYFESLALNNYHECICGEVTNAIKKKGEKEGEGDYFHIPFEKIKESKEIANYYWQIFREDFKKLNISEPDIWCKATEHIKEQIELIKKLEEKGYTYKTSDGIYFDTSKLKDYGKLSGLKKEGLQAGVRVEMKEKKNSTDFALWKFSLSGQAKRQQEWESPWGIGFPGWHIECSAMSLKYLGEYFDSFGKLRVDGEQGRTIDIHTGGEDHISIHHTNEIAQSEAATGKKFVNYWLHGAFLSFKNAKISKSTEIKKSAETGKNMSGRYTISELEKNNFNPLSYRYLCLSAHYRSSLAFDLESLTAAQNALNNLYQIVGNFPKPTTSISEIEEKFDQAINDDLNTPKALAIVWDLLKEKYPDEQKMATLLKFDQVLGLDLDKIKPIEIPEKISVLAKEREELRKQKKWSEADQVRKKIEDLGFTVEDAEQGSIIKKI
ncbi:MAG: cysteine--tRNA ligase [Patescibacteria group bacterium]|nr:cysteine--tRNA ligase [Patescibacteria group bacterium]